MRCGYDGPVDLSCGTGKSGATARQICRVENENAKMGWATGFGENRRWNVKPVRGWIVSDRDAGLCGLESWYGFERTGLSFSNDGCGAIIAIGTHRDVQFRVKHTTAAAFADGH